MPSSEGISWRDFFGFTRTFHAERQEPRPIYTNNFVPIIPTNQEIPRMPSNQRPLAFDPDDEPDFDDNYDRDDEEDNDGSMVEPPVNPRVDNTVRDKTLKTSQSYLESLKKRKSKNIPKKPTGLMLIGSEDMFIEEIVLAVGEVKRQFRIYGIAITATEGFRASSGIIDDLKTLLRTNPVCRDSVADGNPYGPGEMEAIGIHLHNRDAHRPQVIELLRRLACAV